MGSFTGLSLSPLIVRAAHIQESSVAGIVVSPLELEPQRGLSFFFFCVFLFGRGWGLGLRVWDFGLRFCGVGLGSMNPPDMMQRFSY